MDSNFKSLDEFVQEIHRRESAKVDLVAPASAIRMEGDNDLAVTWPTNNAQVETQSGKLTSYAHGQVASKLNIPKQYYDRIGEVEGLRSYTVNRLMEHRGGKHLVRFLDDKARAILSDKFFPIDNQIVMEGSVLRAFERIGQNIGQLEVVSHSLSDTRLYMQVTVPTLQKDVKVGDPVRLGLTVTNSEVGAGALDVALMLWRLRCMNGMTGQSILRRVHVGGKLDEGDLNNSEFRHETIVAILRAFRMRLEDGIVSVMNGNTLDEMVDKLRGATEQRIERPDVAVKNVTEHLGMTETDYNAIMDDMGRSGDWTRYGLLNGVTALAHGAEPDKGYEYERLGQRVIDMPASEWKRLAVDVAA